MLNTTTSSYCLIVVFKWYGHINQYFIDKLEIKIKAKNINKAILKV